MARLGVISRRKEDEEEATYERPSGRLGVIGSRGYTGVGTTQATITPAPQPTQFQPQQQSWFQRMIQSPKLNFADRFTQAISPQNVSKAYQKAKTAVVGIPGEPQPTVRAVLKELPSVIEEGTRQFTGGALERLTNVAQSLSPVSVAHAPAPGEEIKPQFKTPAEVFPSTVGVSPKTTAEKVARGAGTMAGMAPEFYIPGLAEEAITAKIATKIPQATGLLMRAVRSTATRAPGMAAAGTTFEVQEKAIEGEMPTVKDVAKEAGLWTLFSPIPGFMKWASKTKIGAGTVNQIEEQVIKEITKPTKKLPEPVIPEVKPKAEMPEVVAPKPEVARLAVDTPTGRIYTSLSPKEQSFFKDEVENLIQTKGKKVLHLDSGPIGEAKELNRQDFFKIYPEAQKSFNKFNQSLKPGEVGGVDKVTYDKNFANKIDDFNRQITQLKSKLKFTPSESLNSSFYDNKTGNYRFLTNVEKNTETNLQKQIYKLQDEKRTFNNSYSPPVSGGAKVGEGAKVKPSVIPEVKPKVELPEVVQSITGQKTGLSKLGGLPAPISKEGFIGNIRMNKLDLTPEAKSQYQNTWLENWDDLAKQTRGVKTWAETTQSAERSSKTIETFMKTPKGKAFNAEELKRLDMVAGGKAEEVAQLKDLIYLKGQNNTENLLKLQQATIEQAGLQQIQMGARAEAGRTLNILKSTSKALQTKDEAMMNKVLKSLGGREFTEDMAKKLASFDPTDTEGIYDFIRNLHKPKFTDYIEELWYNSILSGPITHLRNIIGNTTNLAFETAAQPISVIGKKGAVKESINTFVGGFRGLQEGIKKGLYALQHGYKAESAAMLEIRRPQAIKGKLGTIVNLPTRLLTASDEIFRSVFKSRELWGKATEIAQKEGLKGTALNNRIAELIKNPTIEMMEAANKYGARGVFQTAPDKATAALSDLTNSFKPTKFVIPFIQTPSNIMKQGLEAGPLGFLKLGRETIRERNMAIARATLGSLTLAGLATYAMQDRISGSGRSLDAAERDALYRTGWQPNSIKIGNKWYSYQNINPVNIPLSMVGNAYELYKKKEKAIESKDIAEIAFKVGNSLLDQSYLQGISNLFNALDSPEQEGLNWFNRTVSSFASPGIVSQTMRLFKPEIYKTKTLPEMLKQRYGVTEGLIPKRNAFGEPITGQRATGIPFFPTTEQVSPLEDILRKAGVDIGFPSTNIAKTKLSPEEYDQYLEQSGQAIKKELEGRIGYLRELSPSELEDEVKKIVDNNRKKVRERLFKKYYKK